MQAEKETQINRPVNLITNVSVRDRSAVEDICFKRESIPAAGA